jgi:hypothetical protein
MQTNYLEMQSDPTEQATWRPLIFRSFEVWLVIAAAESLHGTFRTIFLSPVVGDFRARQIAVFSGSIIIVAIAIVFRLWMNARSLAEQAVAGAFWVLLTLAFEIALGRLAMDLAWDRIFSDYDLSHGGLMPFGLLILLLAPAIAARIRRRDL